LKIYSSRIKDSSIEICTKIIQVKMANGLKGYYLDPDTVTTAATMANQKRKKQTKTDAAMALFS